MLTTRRFETVLAASTNNVSVNELGVAPGPGAVSVWAASDAVDGLLTVRVGGNLQVNRQIIRDSGTDAPIQTEQEGPMAGPVVVRGGERITVDYVEVTAAACRIIIGWAGEDRGMG